jgi:hypothetical protein
MVVVIWRISLGGIGILRRRGDPRLRTSSFGRMRRDRS